MLTNTVPYLKEISSFAVAIALWMRNNIPQRTSAQIRCTQHHQEWYSLSREVRQSVGKLLVPSSIAKHISTYVAKIENEIHNWVSYHLKTILFKDGNDFSLYYHVYELIWNPDGTINYKETARNLMSSVRLSDMEKYRFLCMYCLKNDMEKMPLSLFSDRVKDNVRFDEYPLICYWNCYFRNELNLASPSETLPSNLTMVLRSSVDNWPSKEYFFDRLSAEEQVQCAKTLITRHQLKYQKLILMKLNETQRLQMYLDNAVEVMTNYVPAWINLKYNQEHHNDILSTWLEVRNLISPGQFLTIFQKFLNFQSATDEILTDIWIEASDDLKSYVLKFNNHQIIEKIFRFWKSCSDSEFKLDLLFAILSDADISLKNNITKRRYFDDLCEELLMENDIELLDRLLRLCFPKVEELTNFKRNLAFKSENVREQCAFYYRKGKLNKMNNYLNSLMSSESEVIFQYKRKLLMSKIGVENCSFYVLPTKKKDRMRDIVADSFPTKDLGAEFMKKVIFSDTSIPRLRRSIKKDGIGRVQECIDNYLESNEEDKRMLKKKIIEDEIFLSKLLHRYDESQWKTFIQWALEDDQAIENFKTKLRIDAIFDEILKRCIFRKYDPNHRISSCTFKRKITFGALDRFLNWYFVSPAKMNSYKWRRIDTWLDVDSIETLLKLKQKGNTYLKAMMNWFFGNNTKQIAKFKKKFEGEKIADMV